MPSTSSIIKTAMLAVFICLLVGQECRGQTPAAPKEQDRSDVLRVYTELVQTDVMVFDRDGKFVNGLKREDFELRIDGKLKPIDFFEKVMAGTVSEESQIAAARGSSTRAGNGKSPAPVPLDRGRSVFFYIDDFHLDLPALQTTRKLIARFIDQDMGQNDQAAVTSASGQLGFLQQLTDNPTVLRAALDRLKIRPYSVRDVERPTMSEYQALLFSNYDRDIRDFFIQETVRQNPGMNREMAESMVSNRAQSLLQYAGSITGNTLSGLESLVRAANKLPGRKLVFFISGGFFLDDRNSDARNRLQRITSAAARSGVVIYSMDARGLVASLTDASTDVQFDPTGVLSRSGQGELFASQDAMNALAADTGGKAIFNTNSLDPGLARALKDTSAYYLLAWKPENEKQHGSKFRRLEVKVVGRPQLTVQVRRGFFDIEPPLPETKNSKAKKAPEPERADKSTENDLTKVMFAPYPTRDIPVSLTLHYVNTAAKGQILSAVMEVSNEFLSFVPTDGKRTAILSVAGTFLDEHGKAGAVFGNKITMNDLSIDAAKEGNVLSYTHSVLLGPGLYQVRVAARDERTGRSGSENAWIEIPDLASGHLALSSLLVGVRAQSTTPAPTTSAGFQNLPVELRITHNVSVNDYLRFVVFIYNAARAPADSKPDLAIQVQIVRDAQPVVTTPLKKISIEDVADLARVSYAAETSLAGLPAGRYLLRVTVVDRVAKSSAAQQARFNIE
jgi:VWFA-related protein